MGILNNKHRIMDVILTEVGKRQLSQGKLVIEHASLTDKHTFYEHDIVSGSSDATKRIYFEANVLPSDTIVYETDDSGQLITYTAGDLALSEGGTIFSGSSAVTGSLSNVEAFSSMTTTLLSSSLDNFKHLQTISTKNVFNDDDFEISNKEIVFDFGDAFTSAAPGTDPSHIVSPINDQNPHCTTVDGTLPTFYDWRLSSHPNLRYLPPVNKANAADDFQYEYITNEDYAETGAYSTDEYTNISKSFQWTISAPDTSVYSGLVSSRTTALAIANLTNAESVEVSDGTYKKPDGRVCLGMYQPVVMLPDLDSQENLDVSTNLLVTTGAPPAGTFPFQRLEDPTSLVPDIGWKAIYSPMKEMDTDSGQSIYRSCLPCNGTMLPDTGLTPYTDLLLGHLPRSFDILKNISQKISCVENSLDSNLLIQFFETNPETGTMTKLDLVSIPDIKRSTIFSSTDYDVNAKMFFAGKIFIDSMGVPHFVNLFTVVMAKEYQLKESGFIE